MRCPKCGYYNSKVVDSRPYNNSASIKRRRECFSCGYKFTTYEQLENKPIVVIKRNGSAEEFDSQKLLRGILVSCAKRPIETQVIESLISEITNSLTENNIKEIKSSEIGEMVLEKLVKIDDVAYIRFASVYKDFDNIKEFEEFLKNIK